MGRMVEMREVRQELMVEQALLNSVEEVGRLNRKQMGAMGAKFVNGGEGGGPTEVSAEEEVAYNDQGEGGYSGGSTYNSQPGGGVDPSMRM